MIQFWKLEQEPCGGGRRILTTSGQPFTLRKLYRGLSWYRKHCLNHVVQLDEEVGLQSPLGRVFLNARSESSPDLRFYSVKEYPLRDDALRCGLRQYLASPVFQLHGPGDHNKYCCVGVLEFVGLGSGTHNPQLKPQLFFGLSLDLNTMFYQDGSSLRLLLHHHMDDDQPDTQKEGRKAAMDEIKEVFKVVNETPYIPLALAWIPCNSNHDALQLSCYSCDQEWHLQQRCVNDDFYTANTFHVLHRHQGVAGRALSSPHKLCFCRTVHAFNITQYPPLHYARRAMLAASFAICLRSTHSGSDPYVLEFFMRPGNLGDDPDNPLSLIQYLLVKMEQELGSFQLHSGHRLGNPLVLEVIRFPMDDEAAYFQRALSDRYPLEYKMISAQPPELPPDAEERSPVGRRTSPSPPLPSPIPSAGDRQVDSNMVPATNLELNDSTNSTTSSPRTFQISYEQLQPHFGTRQKVAANALGVSPSTLKRACRQNKIARWPFHPKNKANPSLFVRDDLTSQPDAGSSKANSNLSTGTMQLDPDPDPSPSCEDATRSSPTGHCVSVTVKASYKSKNVKFALGIPSGVRKLKEEIARRLNLKVDNLELSYEDTEEDGGGPIYLTCDDDLSFYFDNFKSSTLQLTVRQPCESDLFDIGTNW